MILSFFINSKPCFMIVSDNTSKKMLPIALNLDL